MRTLTIGIVVTTVTALIAVGLTAGAARAEPAGDTASRKCTEELFQQGYCLPFVGSGDPELTAISSTLLTGNDAAAQNYIDRYHRTELPTGKSAAMESVLASAPQQRAMLENPEAAGRTPMGVGGRSGTVLNKYHWRLNQNEPVGYCWGPNECQTKFYLGVLYDLDLDQTIQPASILTGYLQRLDGGGFSIPNHKCVVKWEKPIGASQVGYYNECGTRPNAWSSYNILAGTSTTMHRDGFHRLVINLTIADPAEGEVAGGLAYASQSWYTADDGRQWFY